MRKNRRNAQNNSKNAVKSINVENEILENKIMNINFNYNVVEDTVVIIRTENETLRNIALRQNFQNEHIKKNVFDENTRFLIE